MFTKEVLIIAGFLAVAAIATALAFLLTTDKRLRLAGLMMLGNCVLSNVLVANYHNINDLEQYMMVPGICFVTVYLLGIDHKTRWLYILLGLFLVELLVSVARAAELVSHLAYFITVDATYTLECITIMCASLHKGMARISCAITGTIQWIKRLLIKSLAGPILKRRCTPTQL